MKASNEVIIQFFAPSGRSDCINELKQFYVSLPSTPSKGDLISIFDDKGKHFSLKVERSIYSVRGERSSITLLCKIRKPSL